ncbi:MAG TPA: M4 family metallopeptidase [Vicinamibacterales bacterium]|jgi:Zn-dependent metalloprotease
MRLRLAALVAGLVALVSASTAAQRPLSPPAMVIASTPQTIGAWDARVRAMLQNGQLDIGRLQRDSLISGRTHVRLDQRYQGLPVFGGQVVRQQSGQTTISVFGRFFQNISINAKPTLTAAAAAHAAVAAQGADSVASGPPVLGVLPGGSHGYVLAYRVLVRAPWDIQIYYIDANTGAVVSHASRIKKDQAAAAIGSGTGVNGDREKVSANQSGGTYQAIDVMRPAVTFTLDFGGNPARFNSFFTSGQVFLSDVATSSSNTWTDPVVVDASAYQGMFYDYFYKVMGRSGIDDANLQVVGITHPLSRSDAGNYSSDIVGNYIDNALYLGDGTILYGDGDGQTFTYLAGALDVVAHELTHGITDFSSQLGGTDEPGALNEAFSDIMATAIEFAYQPPGNGKDQADWLIGEDVTLTAPGFIRSLEDPQAGGGVDNYSKIRDIGTSNDNGGVHENSTIASHAFYLAVHGGTNRTSGMSVQGVGMANLDRVAKAFYRGFVFMLGPNSTFSDARRATLQAAQDLYGSTSNEYAQIQQAWTAVGVH